MSVVFVYIKFEWATKTNVYVNGKKRKNGGTYKCIITKMLHENL